MAGGALTPEQRYALDVLASAHAVYRQADASRSAIIELCLALGLSRSDMAETLGVRDDPPPSGKPALRVVNPPEEPMPQEWVDALRELSHGNVYRVETNRPVPPHRTRVRFIEATDEKDVVSFMKDPKLSRKGITVTSIRQATEADLQEYLAAS